jgi:hypothetical protein
VQLVSGCAAGTSAYLGSEPALHFPVKTTIALPDNIKNFIKVHCLETAAVKYEDLAPGATENGKCLYTSADVSAVGAATVTVEVRNEIIGALVTISDTNCRQFLNRAFAQRSTGDFTKTFLQDIATALSAVTAHGSPALASTLSGTNLIVGKGYEAFDATFYVNKTFDAMETSIRAERTKRYAKLIANQDEGIAKYSLSQALNEVGEYDDACSIKTGLASLAAAADTSNKASEKGKLTVENTPKPVAGVGTTKLQVFQQQFVK